MGRKMGWGERGRRGGESEERGDEGERKGGERGDGRGKLVTAEWNNNGSATSQPPGTSSRLAQTPRPHEDSQGLRRLPPWYTRGPETCSRTCLPPAVGRICCVLQQKDNCPLAITPLLASSLCFSVSSFCLSFPSPFQHAPPLPPNNPTSLVSAR